MHACMQQPGRLVAHLKAASNAARRTVTRTHACAALALSHATLHAQHTCYTSGPPPHQRSPVRTATPWHKQPPAGPSPKIARHHYKPLQRTHNRDWVSKTRTHSRQRHQLSSAQAALVAPPLPLSCLPSLHCTPRASHVTPLGPALLSTAQCTTRISQQQQDNYTLCTAHAATPHAAYARDVGTQRRSACAAPAAPGACAHALSRSVPGSAPQCAQQQHLAALPTPTQRQTTMWPRTLCLLTAPRAHHAARMQHAAAHDCSPLTTRARGLPSPA